MKKIILLTFLMLSSVSLQAQEELTWHTDLTKATDISIKENKPLFLFFTGSDWCGWCIRLQNEVFKTPEFITWAKKNVVLVELDFPKRKEQADAIKMQNAQLQQQLQVRGYPTVWFVSAAKTADAKVNLKAKDRYGLTALVYALKAKNNEIVDLIKERAKSLTLVASAGGGKEAPFPLRLQTLPIIGEFLPSPNFEQFKLGWELAFYDKKYLTEERVKKKFEDSNKANAKKSHLKTLRQMINIFGFKRSDYTNLSSKVGRITCPVLIVWGANDLFLPLEHAHNFNKKIKNSKLVIFNECGHAPQIERSKEFNDLLTKFIVI